MFHRAVPLLPLLAALPAVAEPVSTDRPTTTFAATVVPKGSLQIESGFGFGVVDSETAIAHSQAISVAVRGGLGKNFELRLDVVPWTRSAVAFLGSGGAETDLFPVLSPGLKYGLVTGDFSAALVASGVIATGSEVAMGAMGAVAFSKQIGAMSFFGGVATTVGGGGLALTGSFGGSVLLGVISPFSEVQLRSDGDEVIQSQSVGLLISPSESVQVDVFADFGPDLGERHVYTFGVGLSLRHPR